MIDEHILYCPLCGADIHAWSPHNPTPQTNDELSLEAELLAIQHFRRSHPRRFRLWQRFGWRWPVRGFFG